MHIDNLYGALVYQNFMKNQFFGYGPDTSNFIEDGQRVIGSQFTGTMKFIPSHPHNFLIELILETGLLGTLSFIMFIIVLNYKIFLKANTKERGFLIFLTVIFGAHHLLIFHSGKLGGNVVIFFFYL